MTTDDTSIRAFAIDVADDVLDDLRRRLGATRWPDAGPVDDWSQGVPLAWLRPLADHWLHDYDWRARERELNRLDQFLTTIDGIDVHFVHVRSPHPDATPLVVTHGWPSSFAEFRHVIGPLTDPTAHGGDAADAFHVVCPSLPGFAFSGVPTSPGVGVERIAAMWAELLHRLGYDRYLAQGGDWGSSVTSMLAATDPGHCAGAHMTLAMTTGPSGPPEHPDEVRALERLQHYLEHDSGYSTIQKTRPQTVGYALHDSPVGQLAWIADKFWSWTDCAGDPLRTIDRDELLDHVMLYWVTGSATSSARLYRESFGSIERHEVHVPVGFAVYPHEIVPPVRSWVSSMFTDIVHWSEQPHGGHFAAFEVPDLFVDDLRAFARAVRGARPPG